MYELVRFDYRNILHARLPGSIHNQHQGAHLGLMIRLNDYRSSWVFRLQLVNIGSNLRLDDRTRITIENNFVIGADLKQDIFLLVRVIGWWFVIVVIATGSVNGGFR